MRGFIRFLGHRWAESEMTKEPSKFIILLHRRIMTEGYYGYWHSDCASLSIFIGVIGYLAGNEEDDWDAFQSRNWESLYVFCLGKLHI